MFSLFLPPSVWTNSAFLFLYLWFAPLFVYFTLILFHFVFILNHRQWRGSWFLLNNISVVRRNVARMWGSGTSWGSCGYQKWRKKSELLFTACFWHATSKIPSVWWKFVFLFLFIEKIFMFWVCFFGKYRLTNNVFWKLFYKGGKQRKK